MNIYIPPPAPPRVLYHAAHAVLGVALLVGLLAGLYLAGAVLAAIMGGL